MQIVADSQRNIRTDDRAGIGNPVAFGIVHAFDIHCAVHGKIKTVERQGRPQLVGKFLPESFIGRPRDRAAWNGAGVKERKDFHTLGRQEAEILSTRQIVTAQHAKIFRLHENRRIGGALRMNAADCNA